MGSMVWTEIKDLKDTLFFVCLDANYINDDLVYSSPPIGSELGVGYIHILDQETAGDVIYSYNINNKTIFMSSMGCLNLPRSRSISVWTIPGFRLHGKPNYCSDQMVISATATNDDDDEVEQMNEASLLNIPFDVLENIIKFCVGIEYLNFRASCKLCRLAAPVIQWSNERKRLQTYSLVSPWLMVVDKDQGIITFTDPMCGDNNYFIKASPELFFYPHRILCSRHGWLLFYTTAHRMVFFNPSTSDIHKLPPLLSHLEMSGFSFSAPPTSPDCMVVVISLENKVFFHRVGREPFWHEVSLNYYGDDPHLFWFPTFCDKDVYTLLDGGGLEVFRETNDGDNLSWKHVADAPTAPAPAPRRSTWAEYYQVKCDQHHLLVIVEDFGESVEVFELNNCTQKWEKIDGLGRHMIYICDASCLCMDSKTLEMENKIYFQDCILITTR